MKINDIKLRSKVAILVLIPTIGLLVLAASQFSDKLNINDEMGHLLQLSEISVKVSTLLHETQKERGATAVFLGSKGKLYKKELAAQRLSTNEPDKILRDALNAFDMKAMDVKFQKMVAAMIDQLDQLADIRRNVDLQVIPAPKAISYYTGFNGKMISIIRTITAYASDIELGNMGIGFVNFLEAKERARIERAV